MQEKVRTVKIEIETPRDRKQRRVIYHREALLLGDDGKIVGRAGAQPEPISFDFVDEQATMRTFSDPVTGTEHTLSIAGIAAAIAADFNARNLPES